MCSLAIEVSAPIRQPVTTTLMLAQHPSFLDTISSGELNIVSNHQQGSRSWQRFFISKRAFHRVNVTAAKVFNAPLLLPIAAWERRRTIFDTPRRFLLGMKKRLLTYASPHHDLQLVFEHLPPDLQVRQHRLK